MTQPSPENVAAEALLLGRELSSRQAEALSFYLTALAKWSRVMNLVGRSGWPDVLAVLVADSWHLADFLGRLPLASAPRTLDLGAGAGLPGIPLRLFWEAGEYTLVEVREKRAAFMRHVLGGMGLPRTSVAACRFEDLGPDRLPADLILGRAFRPWPEFLALARGMLAPDGICLIMANEPPPSGEAEGLRGWRAVADQAYSAGGAERYFWSFTPVIMDR